jgi:hypothetical protein
MIGKILGLGQAAKQVGEAVGGVAEVFVGNRADRDAAEHAQFIAALGQFSEEFRNPNLTWFDQFVNGLNRLPRPMLAVGTLSLFVYSMVDPAGFAERMQGLAYVPEPLWWLLGAVVSFYFGARELHHYRGRSIGATLDLPMPLQQAPEAEPPARSGAATRPGPAIAFPEAEVAYEAPAPVVHTPALQTSARPVPRPRSQTEPEVMAAPQPVEPGPARQVPPAARPAIAVRASDPEFNAAVEEWRATNAA